MRAVNIVSTGAYLPGEPITNAELAERVGPVPDDILEGIAVKQRHWIADPSTGEHRCTNSEMAVHAGRQALERAGLTADDVDLLVVSTASPEYPLPPTATLVQDGLGLRRCATIDVRSGCAGSVEALDIARLYVERGLHETALVIGSEVISPLLVPLYLDRDRDRIRLRDRIVAYTFGDGAGAMVVRAGGKDTRGILGSALACVGGGRKPGMQIVGYGTHAPVHRQHAAKRPVDLRIDVVESARFTPAVISEALSELLPRCGVRASDVDACILPEGNAGYLADEFESAGANVSDWLELSDRVVENLAVAGATGSAAVPLALDDAWTSGRVKPGDLVMLLAIETSKWKYAGTLLEWTAPVPAAAERLSAAA
jgi:3-oxoacyl-[acyl-carrier-protein] synthase-3